MDRLRGFLGQDACACLCAIPSRSLPRPRAAGIFLFRQREVAWFLHGMRRFFPETWSTSAAYLPEAERHDLLGACRKRLNDPDPAPCTCLRRATGARTKAHARRYCPIRRPSPITARTRRRSAWHAIEAHYFASRGFLAEGELLVSADRLRDIRGIIVHGRYDVVCPIQTADALHRDWPEAEYIVVPDAGHSAWEPGICAQLVAAMEKG